MHEINSFLVIPALADKTKDQLAPFGALSPAARTYTKEQETLTTAVSGDVQSVVFRSMDNDTHIPLTSQHESDLLKVGEIIADLIITNGIPETPALLQEKMLTDYVIEDMSDVTVDSVYIEAGIKGIGSITWFAHGTRYKLWCANEIFSLQFPYYEIDVSFPVTNIDDMLRPKADVVPLVKSVGDILEEASADNNTHAATKVTVSENTWHERDNLEITLPVFFGLEIYGKAGYSKDLQRKAIADKILAESSYDSTVWGQVFPEIFTVNEMYFLPFWNNISLPGENLIGSMYSSVLTPSALLAMADKYSHGYDSGHVATHTEFCPLLYKSIVGAAIGSPTNDNDEFAMSDIVPQYVLIHSHSIDYRRVDPEVRDFINTLYELVILAENHTLTTTLPVKVTAELRGDYIYLAKEVNGLVILVNTKYSYMRGEGLDYNPTDTYDFLGDHEC